MKLILILAFIAVVFLLLPRILSGSKTQNTDVDPIAEADVYIAYGRTNQAKEVLKQALNNDHPARKEIQAKLDALEKQQ